MHSPEIHWVHGLQLGGKCHLSSGEHPHPLHLLPPQDCLSWSHGQSDPWNPQAAVLPNASLAQMCRGDSNLKMAGTPPPEVMQQVEQLPYPMAAQLLCSLAPVLRRAGLLRKGLSSSTTVMVVLGREREPSSVTDRTSTSPV